LALGKGMLVEAACFSCPKIRTRQAIAVASLRTHPSTRRNEVYSSKKFNQMRRTHSWAWASIRPVRDRSVVSLRRRVALKLKFRHQWGENRHLRVGLESRTDADVCRGHRPDHDIGIDAKYHYLGDPHTATVCDAGLTKIIRSAPARRSD